MKSEKTKRQLQAEQTKQKLFEAAIEEFESKGYNNVAIEDICKKCGVSKGTFYVHYKSKEDIIKLDFAKKIAVIGERISDYLNTHKNATAQKKLSCYLTLFFQLMAELGSENVKNIFIPTALPTANLYYKDVLFLPELKKIISDGFDSNEFDDNLNSEALLMYLMSFIVGILFMWSNGNNALQLNDMCKDLIACFVKGICRK